MAGLLANFIANHPNGLLARMKAKHPNGLLPDFGLQMQAQGGVLPALATNHPRAANFTQTNPNALLGLSAGLLGGGAHPWSAGMSGFAQGRVVDQKTAADLQTQQDAQAQQQQQQAQQQGMVQAAQSALASVPDAPAYLHDLATYDPASVLTWVQSQGQAAEFNYVNVPDVGLVRTQGADATVAIPVPAPARLRTLTTPADRGAFHIQPTDTGIYQVDDTTGKLYSVGGGGQTIEVNTQQTFADALSSGLANDVLDLRTKAEGAAKSLATLSAARDVLDQGMVAGFGTDLLVSLGNALDRVGIHIAPDERANTQAYIALMAAQVAQIISDFGAGTGLSDADREYAAAAAGGNVAMTESALRRIIDINERAARNAIAFYNQQVSSIPAESQPIPMAIDSSGYGEWNAVVPPLPADWNAPSSPPGSDVLEPGSVQYYYDGDFHSTPPPQQ